MWCKWSFRDGAPSRISHRDFVPAIFITYKRNLDRTKKNLPLHYTSNCPLWCFACNANSLVAAVGVAAVPTPISPLLWPPPTPDLLLLLLPLPPHRYFGYFCRAVAMPLRPCTCSLVSPGHWP